MNMSRFCYGLHIVINVTMCYQLQLSLVQLFLKQKAEHIQLLGLEISPTTTPVFKYVDAAI